MGGVEELYKHFGTLADAKDEASEHESSYMAIIASVKGTPGEKRLASQFITRFFKFFPKLQENAIDAMLDLCEDEDNVIRRQAIKGLPDLCKNTLEHLPRIADVLTQLLQTEDQTELSIVRTALISLFKMEPKGTIGGLFSQILSGDEHVREKAIKFLSATIAEYGKQVLHKSPDTEEYLVEEVKKALTDVTADEFQTFMAILSSLKCMTSNHQALADIVTEQAELSQPFQPTDAEFVDRLLSCARQAIPYFSKGASAETFFSYLVGQVIPALSSLPVSEEGEDIKMEVLKLCAEMSPCRLSDETVKSSIEPIYNLLTEYMPLPPSDDEEKSSDESAEPKFQFSYVECLMFTFHQLAKTYPEFLTAEESAERLKDFRLRLQYFAQGCQVYIKQLRLALQGKGPALQEDENKIKVIALRTTSNINTLIKDLFHNPPSFKSTVTLSWKPPTKPVNVTPSPVPSAVDERRKRAGITPITFDLPPEKKKPSPKKGVVEVYQPPGRRSGAANGAVKGQSMPDSFGQRGRGGFRGRGSRGNRGRGRGGWY